MGWVCEAAGRGPGHMLVPSEGSVRRHWNRHTVRGGSHDLTSRARAELAARDADDADHGERGIGSCCVVVGGRQEGRSCLGSLGADQRGS
jgi:hypothetical protein